MTGIFSFAFACKNWKAAYSFLRYVPKRCRAEASL